MPDRIGKPFLATALMVLVEQGKLKLDDPVEKYLPEFQGIRVEGSQSPARPMTVRHLLSHTGGFWGNKGITSEKLDLIRNFERPLDEVVKRMAEYDLVYEPGTKWIYSGAGYCVAGRVAEVALDQSLEEIVQDALFRPLGLDRTTFLPSKEVRKTLPTRYLRQGGKLQKQPSMAKIEELRFILPGGSLFTTLDELAVFGQMHLNDGVYNGKRILSEASVSEMRRLQSPVRPQRTYGLGWFRGGRFRVRPGRSRFSRRRLGGASADRPEARVGVRLSRSPNRDPGCGPEEQADSTSRQDVSGAEIPGGWLLTNQTTGERRASPGSGGR